jgi:hypothetical protein
MNEDKIRPQILETPYKLQDVCPTRKLKAPEDTLRRIQKKIAFAEKKAALSLENNETAGSIQNESLSLSEQVSPLSMREATADTNDWINEFRKRYKTENFGKKKNGDFEKEWYTVSDIFQQVANAYSNEMKNTGSCVLNTRKL